MTATRIKELEEYKAHIEQAYKDLADEMDTRAEKAFEEGFKYGRKSASSMKSYKDKHISYWLESRARVETKEGKRNAKQINTASKDYI